MKQNTPQVILTILLFMPSLALASSGISSGGFVSLVMYFFGPVLLVAGIFYVLSKTKKNDHSDDKEDL